MNDGNESCKIGDDCLFFLGIKARTSAGHSIIDLPKDIDIFDRAWLGEDVRFLKGSGVSRDSVIASSLVVAKKNH